MSKKNDIDQTIRELEKTKEGIDEIIANLKKTGSKKVKESALPPSYPVGFHHFHGSGACVCSCPTPKK